MGASNVTVIRSRSEAYSGATAGTVTMRAVGLDPKTLKPLVSPGGCVLVFGGPAFVDCEVIRLPSGSMVQRQCFT